MLRDMFSNWVTNYIHIQLLEWWDMFGGWWFVSVALLIMLLLLRSYVRPLAYWILLAMCMLPGMSTLLPSNETLDLSEATSATLYSITSEGINTNRIIPVRKKLLGVSIPGETTQPVYDTCINTVMRLVADEPVFLQYASGFQGCVMTTKDGVNINTYLISQGLAWATPDAPAEYLRLQERAKSQRLGVWSQTVEGRFSWLWDRLWNTLLTVFLWFIGIRYFRGVPK